MQPGTRYYVCPMMLQKMHPDFDRALAAILRRDPDAEVLLFADARCALWQTQLEARFAATMPEVAERIVFRPYAARDAFHSILMAADCVLDPFHFSGGVTTYIALSLGVPVVTLPGALFRSRMTAGIYAQAGIDSLTARDPAHYVELALALARDPSRRAAEGARIVAAHSRIFGVAAAVDDFAGWLDTAMRARD
jgi:predicted O-linked N-acetylglucosamine transferase (SPINDLY family)